MCVTTLLTDWFELLLSTWDMSAQNDLQHAASNERPTGLLSFHFSASLSLTIDSSPHLVASAALFSEITGFKSAVLQLVDPSNEHGWLKEITTGGRVDNVDDLRAKE